MNDYVRDPAEITRLSFAAIRREADLAQLPDDIVAIALRMIHACGMVDLLADLAYSPGAGSAGRAALREGASRLDSASATRVISLGSHVRRRVRVEPPGVLLGPWAYLSANYLI